MPPNQNTLKKNILQKEKNNNSKKRSSKQSESGKSGRSDRIKKMIGAFCFLLAFFLFFGFTSYLLGWFSNNPDDTFSDISLGRILFDDSIEVQNWTGRLGAALSHLFIKGWFGISSYLFILILIFLGIKLLLKPNLRAGTPIAYSIFGMLWISITLGFIFQKSDSLLILGGTFGYQANGWFRGILGNIGTGFLQAFVFICFLIVAFNFPFHLRKKKSLSENNEESPEENRPINIPFDSAEARVTGVQDLSAGSSVPVITDHNDSPGGIDLELESSEIEKNFTDSDFPKEGEYGSLDSEYDPLLDLRDYKYPPLDLLNDYGESNIGVRKEELEANKNRIVETLNNYDISIDKIKATIGPAVTLYEIIPPPGVRISKIKNLEDDIALSLAALGIRIIAPLPGKGTIGIEVPNQNPEVVSIKSILSSERFQTSKYALPFGLGKTISNESYIADLTKMPHILMAGATGQGKSVGLNTIITSLLYKKHPSQLKFILVDPKKVELSLFAKIERHFLAKLPDLEDAIITDIRQVVRTLHSLSIEMDSRYDLLRDAGVRNIQEYNAKFLTRKLNPNEGHRFLPYIVVVVDEFADLIITAGKEIETPLTRLAQLSRAIGIHLIIATQRPSVNIITGLIKANFPTRIAFRVISKIDSRTILDSNGAEQLIGRGDMLIGTGSDLVRLQCAYVDIEEVERVSEYIGSQRGYPTAFDLPEYFDEKDEPNKDFDPTERDELFEDGARLVVQYQHGSTSLLQRKLKLGYNRAGRIIDQLEAAGIVGPFEGSKAREVKVKTEMELEHYLRDFGQTKDSK